MGISFRQSGFSCEAARKKIAKERMTKSTTSPVFSRPAGSALFSVLGFRRSIALSIRRLSPIAALRAPTIASEIQPASAHVGSRPSIVTAPSSMPM